MVLPDSRRLVEALAGAAREHAHTLCVGRTHGIHAEPTTFGIKLASFAFEADRNAERLTRAFAQVGRRERSRARSARTRPHRRTSRSAC